MEKVIERTRYSVIEPKYEFSAPQYLDFSVEECYGDIERAEQWFTNKTLPEASPHDCRIGSVLELIAAIDNSGQDSDKEARKVLAHVSYGPRQMNEQDTIDWGRLSEYEVAPEGLTVDWLEDYTSATIPAVALVTSSMPTKRSIVEVCEDSTHSSETMRKKPNSAVIRNKVAVRKAQPLEEFQARKRQKLDGGRTKQITQRSPSTQEPREVSPFVSMAERVQKFLHKTPPRFHVLPAKLDISQLLETGKPKSLKLTVPKTPEFRTVRRARSSRFKSTEEIENEELGRIPKFKARPFNKRVFKSSGELGLLRIQKRKVTVPVEFSSETSRRAQVRNTDLRIQKFDKDQGLSKKIKTIDEKIERKQKEARGRIPEVQNNLSKAPIFTPVLSTNPLADISESKFNVEKQVLECDKKKEEMKVNNAMCGKVVVVAKPAPQLNEPSIPKRSMKGLTKVVSPTLSLKAPRAIFTTSCSRAEDTPLEQKRIFMR